MPIVLFFLVFGVLILSPVVLAQGPPDKKGWEFRGGRGMMGPPPHPMMDWADRLNLSNEQKARIQELREAYLRDTLVWRNERVVKRLDLQDLLRNPQAAPKEILAKQREISELDAKIEERTLLFHLEMRKVLTAEQIKLLPPGWGGRMGPPMMPGRRGMGREY